MNNKEKAIEFVNKHFSSPLVKGESVMIFTDTIFQAIEIASQLPDLSDLYNELKGFNTAYSNGQTSLLNQLTEKGIITLNNIEK